MNLIKIRNSIFCGGLGFVSGSLLYTTVYQLYQKKKIMLFIIQIYYR